MSDALFHQLRQRVDNVVVRRPSGRVASVTGPLVRADLPGAAIGEICELHEPAANFEHGCLIAEVVGLDGPQALLSVLGDTRGISIKTEVFPRGGEAMVDVGDHLIGAVIDAAGRPLRPAKDRRASAETRSRPLHGTRIDVVNRAPIVKPLAVGILAIDGLLTCGAGQRLGIFGSAGSGKSTLIADIIANADADVVVTALIGERGREANEFIARTMPAGKESRCTLVVSTSDRPALERYRAALLATTIAEHFRDEGKRVLLIIDSITRLARALREVGLAAGEPSVRRGFPPSVFNVLPQLFERAGNNQFGSMSAFYTVLVEGNEADDPIAEETRSLLDGHIVLSNELAAASRFPAIDILASRSRTMSFVTDASHQRDAAQIRSWLATIKEMELLVRIGEYRAGQDADIDKALAKRRPIEAFLYGAGRSGQSYESSVSELAALAT